MVPGAGARTRLRYAALWWGGRASSAPSLDALGFSGDKHGRISLCGNVRLKLRGTPQRDTQPEGHAEIAYMYHQSLNLAGRGPEFPAADGTRDVQCRLELLSLDRDDGFRMASLTVLGKLTSSLLRKAAIRSIERLGAQGILLVSWHELCARDQDII